MKTRTKSLGGLFVLVVLAVGNHFYPGLSDSRADRSAAPDANPSQVSAKANEQTQSREKDEDPGFAQLQKAVAGKKSEVWFAETEFEVVKILSDDLKGAKHQRFIVKRDGLPTFLVAHNIDIAPRAPIEERGAVAICGRYEWNEKGGVIHWTHGDPKGYVSGGWIRVEDTKYK